MYSSPKKLTDDFILSNVYNQQLLFTPHDIAPLQT